MSRWRPLIPSFACETPAPPQAPLRRARFPGWGDDVAQGRRYFGNLAPASAATPARRADARHWRYPQGQQGPGRQEPAAPGGRFHPHRRYEIEACVGEGGSGFVFRAFDKVLGQRLALKVLHAELASDKSWIKRLKREVRVAREIQHPNVCRVFDLGRADGHWFITMEYAAGGSLRQSSTPAR